MNFFLPRRLQALSAKEDPAAARRFDGHTLRIKDTTYLGPDYRKDREHLLISRIPPPPGWLFYSGQRDRQTARVSLVISPLQS